MCLFLLSLSIQAQDVPTEEPAPAEATTQPLPDVLQTDIPVATPTIEPVAQTTTEPMPVTPDVPVAVTPGATAEATVAPVTPEATSEATDIVISPEAPAPTPIAFPLLYKAQFEGSDAAGLSRLSGWTAVLVDGGKALQASVGAAPVSYKPAVLAEGAVEASFWLLSGEGQVMLGGYRAGLDANGTVTLARDQMVVATSSVTLASEAWALLRVQVVGAQVQISVNNTLVMDYTDETPLADGLAGFAASSSALLRIDNFAIYGAAMVGEVVNNAPVANVGTTPDPKPATPTNIVATSDGVNITITWEDTDTATTHYEIQWDTTSTTNAGQAFILSSSKTYTQTNLPCGLSYSYRVRAQRTTDNQSSQWTKWVTVRTAPCAATCDLNASIRRVSVGSQGQTQSAERWDVIPNTGLLSTTGRYVLFTTRQPLTTEAANELAVEPIDAIDGYLFDMDTCVTTKVTLGNAENETNQIIQINGMSEDGAQIYFTTNSSGLTPATPYSGMNVFARNPSAGSTVRIPVAIPNNLTSVHVVDVSDDGRYLLLSLPTALSGVTDTNGVNDVVVYDTTLQTTTPISVDVAGTATGNAVSKARKIVLNNGQVYVLFDSSASNLVANDTNNAQDVFVRHVSAGTTTLLSLSDLGTQITNGAYSTDATIANDTLTVVWGSMGAVVTGITAGNDLHYIRRLPLTAPQNATTVLVSRATGVNGTAADSAILGGFISDNARWVVFHTAATNLSPNDTNASYDVFVRDMLTSTTQRISVTNTGSPIGVKSIVTDISGDGSRILFSTAAVLTAGDTNDRCEMDIQDSDPTWPNSQYDFNEPCPDLFVVANPLSAQEAPPAAVTNLSPMNGALINTAVGVSWSALPEGAGSPFTYDVDISSDAGFSAFVAQATGLTAPAYAPSALPAGAYYWRARAVSQFGLVGAWASSSFIVPAAGSIAAPVNLYADNTWTGRPLFGWTPVAGALNYTIEVNNVCGDGSFYYQVTTAAYEMHYFPGALARLPQGQYFYCIKATDAQGNSSPYSAPYAFKVAYNYSPLDEGIQPAGVGLALDYYSYGDASITYKFYIDDDPGFSSPLYTGGPVGYYNGIGRHNAPAINTPGTYYWRVERLVNGTPEPITSPVSFKLIIGTAGSTPALTSPANDTVINAPITLTWAKSVTQPSFATITHYQLEISTAWTFLNTVVKVNISKDAAQQYTFVPPANTDYTPFVWRVRGVSGNDVVTDFERRTFYVDTIAPVAPTITAPTANTVFYTRRPTFRWVRDDNTQNYVVTVKNATTQAEVIAPQTTIQDSLTPSVDLPNGSYILSIQGKDQVNTGPATSVAFSIADVPTVSGLMPANSGVIDPAVGLSWTPLTAQPNQPIYYDIAISTDANFDTVIEWETGWADTSYEPREDDDIPGLYRWPNLRAALTPGLYYWRVRADHSQYGLSAWTTSSFTIEALPAPGAVTGLTPVEGSTLNPQASLSWTAATGPISSFTYDIDISTDAAFTTLAAHVSGITQTSYEPSLLSAGAHYWRVRAVNMYGNAGPWTSSSFTVALLPAPDAPVLNGPIVWYSGRPIFTWQASAGAATYKLEVNDVCGDGTPYYERTNELNSGQIPTNAPRLYQGRYVYCVKAINAQGLESAFASDELIVNYGAPALVNQYATSFSLRFYNMAAEGGETISYKIYIDDEATFTAPYVRETLVFTAANPNAYYFYVTPRLAAGLYYWRVVRYVNGSPEPVHSLVPNDLWVGLDGSIPQKVSPANNAVINGPTTFKWNASTSQPTYGTITHYKLTIGLSPQFVQYIPANGPLEYVYTPAAGLNYVASQWSVTGMINGNQVTGDTGSTFYIDTVAPAVPTITSPTLNEVINNPTPTWQWNTISGVQWYDVQLINTTTQAEIFNTQIDRSWFSTYSSNPQIHLFNGSYLFRVRSKDTINVSDWAEVPFTVQDVLPPSVKNQKPVGGSMVLNQGFTWDAITNADGGPFTYHIQFSTATVAGAEAFVAGIVHEVSDLTQTSYIPTAAALPEGTYRWRVRAINAAGVAGYWNVIYSITIDRTPLAPPVPNAMSYANTGRPTFAWPAVTGGVSYQSEINDVCGDGSPIFTRQSTDPSYLFLMSALPQGSYVFCVRVIDIPGNISSYSAPFAFTVNYSASPANNASTTSRTFIWENVYGITETITYKLQIDDEPAFEAPLVYQSAAISATSHTAPSSLPAGTLYWRVVRLVNGVAEPINIPPFTVNMIALPTATPTATATSTPTLTPTPVPPPPAITNAQPANSTYINATSTTNLTWDAMTGAGAPFTYHVQISTSANFTTLLVDATGLTDTVYPLSSVVDGGYNWRVRAVNANGLAGAWITRKTIVIDRTAPTTAPIPTGPKSSPAATGRPSLQIDTMNGFSSYIIEVNDVCADGTPFYRSNPLSGWPHTIPGTVNPLPQGNYVYCTKGSDAAGNEGPWSAPYAFSISYQKQPENDWLNPTELTWGADAGLAGQVVTYQVQIDNEATFAAPLTYESGLLSGGVLSLPTLPAGRQYWRVLRLVDGVADPIGADFYRAILVGTRPIHVTLTAPDDNASVNGPIVLKWDAPTTLGTIPTTHYRVTIAYKYNEYSYTYAHRATISASGPLEYTYTPAANLDGIEYIWYVDSLNGTQDITGGSGSSLYNSRKLYIDMVVPPVPTILTPASDGAALAARPTFYWTLSAGASSYTVAIKDTANNADIVAEQTVTTTGFVAPTDLPVGSYVMRVRANDQINHSAWAERAFAVDGLAPTSTFTPTATFTPSLTPFPSLTPTSTPIPPTPGSLLAVTGLMGESAPNIITFRWTDTNSDELGYQVQSTNETGSYSTHPANTTSIMSSAPCGTTRTIRVRAYKAGSEYGPWSPWFTFTNAPCTEACDTNAVVRRVSVGSSGTYQRDDMGITGDIAMIQGNYVLFSSSAPLSDDAAERTQEQPAQVDLYRYDITTCTTVKVSVGDEENETLGHVAPGSISSDGNLVVFNTNSRGIAPGDLSSSSNMFVRNISAGTTRQITPLVNGVPVQNAVIQAITSDGRYALMRLNNQVTVPGISDTNNTADIGLYDTVTNTMKIINVTANGTATGSGTSQANQLLVGPNGNVYVVFSSTADNLASGEYTCSGCDHNDVFARDVMGAKTILVTFSNWGYHLKDTSYVNVGVVSSSGFSVAAYSGANNITRYFVDFSPFKANSGSDLSELNSGGGFVTDVYAGGAYSSTASWHVAGDTNGVSDVFVSDGGSSVRVSVGPQGQQMNQPSYARGMTSDGQWVLVETNSMLSPEDMNNISDLFLVRNPLKALSGAGPVNLKLTHTATNTLTASWDAVPGAAGYQLEVSNNGYQWTRNPVALAANQTSHDITNASCVYRTYVRIRSYTTTPVYSVSDFSELDVRMMCGAPLPPSPYPLAFSESFNSGRSAQLSPVTGWYNSVAPDNALVLQSDSAATPSTVLYNPASFTAGMVETLVQVQNGTGSLVWGPVRADLASSGLMSVYHNGQLVGSASSGLTAGQWVVLQFETSGVNFAFKANGAAIVSGTLSSPASGLVGFTAGANSTARLDTFAIYGTPVTAPTATPVTPTPEPTVEVTVEPTLEVTLEPTVEVTVEPTLEVTLEPTLEVTDEPALPTLTPSTTPTPTEEPFACALLEATDVQFSGQNTVYVALQNNNAQDTTYLSSSLVWNSARLRATSPSSYAGFVSLNSEVNWAGYQAQAGQSSLSAPVNTNSPTQGDSFLYDDPNDAMDIFLPDVNVTLPANEITHWQLTFLNLQQPLYQNMDTWELGGTKIIIYNPTTGEPCFVELDVPEGPPVPTATPPGFTTPTATLTPSLTPVIPTPTETPLCPSLPIVVRFGEFLSNGDVTLRVESPSALIKLEGFLLHWANVQTKVPNLKLARMGVGVTAWGSPGGGSGTGPGPLVWQSVTGGTTISPTDSTNTAAGTWLQARDLSTTIDVYLDFEGVTTSLALHGVSASDFNGSTLRISCEPTVEPTDEPTLEPTVEPTLEPTLEPTVEPTEEPTPLLVLVSPADDSVLIPAGAATNVTVPFSWTYEGSAAQYTVQVDDDPAFASLNATCSSAANTCTIPDMGYGAYNWRVLVDNVVFASSQTFAVSPAAPRAVTLVSPLNGRYLLPAERPNVTLAWNWGASPAPTGGAFTYNLEIAADNTFATPLVAQTGVASETLTTSTLLDGTYFWRVQAVNLYGLTGAWSAPFSFIVDSVAPAASGVTVPAANAIVASSRPNIQWSAAADAYRYVIEVNDVCGVGTPYYRSAPLTVLTHNPPNASAALPQGTHNACVTVYDRSDNAVTSTAQTFSVFIGTAPAQAAFTTAAPVFTWTAAAETGKTVTYQVQIDPTGSDFASGDVLLSAPVTTATLTWPSALPAGAYAWRVLRLVDGAVQPFTDPLFRTLFSGTVATGPALTAPANNILVNSDTTLTWDAATPPTNIALTDYEVQVSKNTGYTQIVSSEIVPAGDTLDHTFTPDANQNVVVHYWRVRGLSNGIPVSAWSGRSVRVDNVAPASPNVTAPVAEALLNTTRPALTWAAVTGATQYKINVVYAGTTNEAMPEKLQTTVTLTPAANLTQADLTLLVSAFDGLNWSLPTAVNFKVRLGTAPAQNAVVATDRPAFSWAGVLNATGYTLQVDNDADFSSPLLTQNTTGAGYTLTAAQALTPNIYYWRVKSSNVDWPANSASRTFAYGVALAPASPMTTIDSGSGSGSSLTAQATPAMVKIFNKRQMEGTGVTFAWTPVTPTPLRYQIEISPTALFPRAGTVQYTAAASPVNLTLPNVTDGLKYWRVRAVYSADGVSFGPWSKVASFTLDRAVPSIPVLKSVSGTISSARPTFSWVASIDAVTYHLKVVDVASGLTVIDTSVKTTSYALPATKAALSQNNTQGYSWTVQAEDAAGNRSAVSLAKTFTVFSGIAPSRGQLVPDTTPIFTWGAVTGLGAAEWTLQIATNAAMTDNLYTSPLLPAKTASFTLPNANIRTPGLHYWRMLRVGDNAAAVQPQPFYIVSNTVGTAPTLTQPTNGKMLNKADLTGASLTWAAPTNAGLLGALSGYKVEIAKANTFTAASLVKTETVSGASLPLPALADGIYYWRVRGLFGAEQALGPVSGVFVLKIDQTVPGRSLLTLPITNAVIATTRTPTFTWAAATGTPTQYMLEIATEASFITPLYSVTVPTARVLSHKLPLAQALPNGDYYWRVRAKDAVGNLSVGAARPFTIAAP